MRAGLASRASSPASSSTRTPSRSAVASLLPADSPATTQLVLRDTEDVADAPSALTLPSASRRVIVARAPVMTKVCPFQGSAAASTGARSCRSLTPAARRPSIVSRLRASAK